MRGRPSPVFGLGALVALASAAVVVQTLLWMASSSFDAPSALGLGLVLAFATFAFWLTWKVPENLVSWILAAGIAASIANQTAFSYFERAPRLGLPAPGAGFMLHHLLLWPSLALLGVLVLVFPTGELPSRQGVWVVWTAMVGAALPIPRAVHLAVSVPVAELEDGPSGVPWIDLLSSLGQWLIAVSIAIGVLALLVRLVKAEGLERRQMLYVVPSIVLLCGFVLLEAVAPETGAALVALAVGAGLFPISMGLAILKYRLYEIDRVVSRTVSYALVVAVLGATYLGLVVVLRGLLPVEGDLPVAVSTLVVASLFLPLIRRVQRVVDRRFFRSRYDAGVVVARVADELRRSLDLKEVTDRVGAVVDEVFAPETVGVWVAEARAR